MLTKLQDFAVLVLLDAESFAHSAQTRSNFPSNWTDSISLTLLIRLHLWHNVTRFKKLFDHYQWRVRAQFRFALAFAAAFPPILATFLRFSFDIDAKPVFRLFVSVFLLFMKIYRSINKSPHYYLICSCRRSNNGLWPSHKVKWRGSNNLRSKWRNLCHRESICS